MSVTNSFDWYFDFISPFAYFQHHRLQLLRQQQPDLQITPKPVLFAGLLKHHQHKGPAEIPSKRSMTYRYCHWYANSHNIPFRVPHGHPFNPLPMLRLAVAHHGSIETIDRLFHHIWVQSADDPNFFSIDALGKIDGFKNAAEETTREEVKQRLIANTDEAIERGVFGVPTIAIGEQLFWGIDMTEMALEFLADSKAFDDAEYRRLDQLPVAKARS